MSHAAIHWIASHIPGTGMCRTQGSIPTGVPSMRAGTIVHPSRDLGARGRAGKKERRE